LLLLTEWKEYKSLDWSRVAKEMSRPLVLDARNALSPTQMHDLGFEYHSFGRPKVPISAKA
jgi:UDPglucose 6-dehydrogenase